MFKVLDTSGDGRLSYERRDSRRFLEIDLDKIIKDIDQDKNGYIEYEEFLRVSLNKNTLLSQQNLNLAFDNFDENHNGKLSGEEI